MVLAGVMLKMGLYGVLRFVFPVVPEGVEHWRTTVVSLSLIGMIYASVIAFRQHDLKRLIAWSSLGHVGLMCAGLFAVNAHGINGALFQSLAHAVVVVALLYLAGGMAQRLGTLDMRAMGGIKLKTPRLAALFLLVMIAALALPLTQSFVGEWLMFNGLFQRAPEWAAVGIVGIVLGAVYLLIAYQRVMLGPENARFGQLSDASSSDHWVLVPLIAVTLVLGVHPGPVLRLIEGPVQSLLMNATALLP
jgi:NADH-quinone oxidoreductase subunit M